MNWTKAQSDAINISRRDVLVAAAAGSGKTSTLTERVISAICRDKDPVDISRLLIVTFTEKAAENVYSTLVEMYGIADLLGDEFVAKDGSTPIFAYEILE